MSTKAFFEPFLYTLARLGRDVFANDRAIKLYEMVYRTAFIENKSKSTVREFADAAIGTLILLGTIIGIIYAVRLPIVGLFHHPAAEIDNELDAFGTAINCIRNTCDPQQCIILYSNKFPTSPRIQSLQREAVLTIVPQNCDKGSYLPTPTPSPTPAPPPPVGVSPTVAPPAPTFVPTADPTPTERDERLAALLSFSYAWSNRRNAVDKEALIEALHALKPEDKSFLTKQYELAIKNLTNAETIILAPKRGINQKTMIYVVSRVQDATCQLIADDVRDTLDNETNLITTTDRNEAAIIINITDAGVSSLGNSPVWVNTGYKITATADFEAVWSIDKLIIVSGHNIEGVGRGDARAARRNALLEAARGIVQKIMEKIR
jgi:hypothetical protein